MIPQLTLQNLILNSSIHAGIRAPVMRPKADMRNDRRCGFDTINAREMDTKGAQSIIDRIRERVGNSSTYISVDIDVLDPAFAPGKVPTSFITLIETSHQDSWKKLADNLGYGVHRTATGTPEPGGWSTRELTTILAGLEGLNIIGGDVVEVSPAYDDNGEVTALAAVEVVHAILELMVAKPVEAPRHE